MLHCDLCGVDNAFPIHRDMRDTALGIPGEFSIMQCRRCGLVFLDPQPPADQIQRYYVAGYVPYRKNSWLIRVIKNMIWAAQERQIRRFLRAGSLFEIGAGRGDFLAFLSERGWRVSGLEMDAGSAEAGRARGIPVREGRFEDMPVASDVQYDSIVLAYVLEHLPSPASALEKIHMLLRPGGIAVVSIPNYNSWERRLFGRHWHGFDAPRHFYIFTEETMRQYAENAGLVIEDVRYGMVPNDWIGGIARLLHAQGYSRMARLFTYRNLALSALLFPLAFISALARRSSRFTFILRKTA